MSESYLKYVFRQIGAGVGGSSFRRSPSLADSEDRTRSVVANTWRINFLPSANYVRQVGFDCDPTSTFSCSLTQMVEDQAANDHTGLDPNEVNTTVTPLPATLPLFATGLGGLGLLGWRRKRTTAARK